MDKIVLQVYPHGQRLVQVSRPRLASGSRGAVQIQLSYERDPSWKELAKTAVFYINEDTVYHVLVQDDLATVPQEVLAQDGHFYLGLMGVQGDSIITTEAVRLDVVQGAPTTPTNTPAEPTPNIYEQLMDANGVTQARVNNLAKMKGTANETIYPLEGEHILGGSIKVSGTSAALSFVLDGLHLDAYGSYATDGCILPEIAPLFPNDTAGTSQAYRGLLPIITDYPDLEAYIYPPLKEGDWALLSFYNKSGQATEIYGAHCYCFYDLAAPYIPEVGDLRVGVDGTIYSTAGEAVRAQIRMLSALINQGGVSTINHIELLASGWQGSEGLYSQAVSIDGITEYSKIDINPSVEQLAIFHNKDIAFVTENEGGVVTVYCIGQKPVANYTMQITITEVLPNG